MLLQCFQQFVRLERNRNNMNQTLHEAIKELHQRSQRPTDGPSRRAELFPNPMQEGTPGASVKPEEALKATGNHILYPSRGSPFPEGRPPLVQPPGRCRAVYQPGGERGVMSRQRPEAAALGKGPALAPAARSCPRSVSTHTRCRPWGTRPLLLSQRSRRGPTAAPERHPKPERRPRGRDGPPRHPLPAAPGRAEPRGRSPEGAGLPRPTQAQALLSPGRGSRPRLTRRLAFRPAVFAIRWSSTYFSESSCCSGESAMAAPTSVLRISRSTDTARLVPAPAVRTRPPRQAIGWTKQRGRACGHGNHQWRRLPRGRVFFKRSKHPPGEEKPCPLLLDWAMECLGRRLTHLLPNSDADL